MGHNHEHSFEGSTKKLNLAIFINVLLTLAQVAGGVLSGSLSLIADGLHNFSDAGSLFIAVIARKIGNKPADGQLSYGYKRAEILGALINSTSLILVGVYLCYESVDRYFNLRPIDGWVVVWVASLALVIDIATAMLTYFSGAKESLNLKAAFIHNVSDAFASVGVIVSGTLIILYQWYVVDLIVTVVISAYVIFHGGVMMKQCTRILMQAVPDGLSLASIEEALEAVEGVKSAKHIHLWQLDDKKVFFEGHILVDEGAPIERVRASIKYLLLEEFRIGHSTIEIFSNETKQSIENCGSK